MKRKPIYLKNVIIINDFNYSQGGASKIAIDTANMLANTGMNVFFVSAVSDENSTLLSNDVVEYRFHGKEFLSYSNKAAGMLKGLKNVKFSRFVNEILSNFSPDDTVVHIHGWTKACSSNFFNVIKKREFRAFLTLHEYFSVCPNGALFNYPRNIVCNIKGGSKKCLYVNCDSRNYFFKIYRFIRNYIYRKDIDFNYFNAIFVSTFEKKIIENQLRIKRAVVIENPIEKNACICAEKRFHFIYIGRSSKEKGIDLFIDLARRLQDKRFILVGNYDGDILDNLYITGWVSEADVKKYLAESRYLVFPSLWPETYGLNVVTALNMGIPCLVSSNTAAAEYIVNGENGFVFEQGNYDDLFNKAQLLLEGKYNVTPVNKETRYCDLLLDFFNTMDGRSIKYED